MKRDMDLVREILLRVEEADKECGMEDLLPEGVSEDETRKYEYHLDMLVNQTGFVTGVNISGLSGETWIDLKLTWNGHEFLEAVRDPEIWRRAKEGAKKVGSASIDFLWEAAKAYARHLAKEKLGFPLIDPA